MCVTHNTTFCHSLPLCYESCPPCPTSTISYPVYNTQCYFLPFSSLLLPVMSPLPHFCYFLPCVQHTILLFAILFPFVTSHVPLTPPRLFPTLCIILLFAILLPFVTSHVPLAPPPLLSTLCITPILLFAILLPFLNSHPLP